ncbi:MAG: transmembrane sensor [Marinoscillum sp.]|jgi:transmembrane sensor
MTSWDDKLKEKLDSYEYHSEAEEHQVQNFFNQMDGKASVSTTGFPWMKIAAVLLVTVGLSWVVYQFAEVTIITELAETKDLILPDGSEIALNVATEVNYNRISWYWKREVKLEGEAFFKVKKGSDFAVLSDLGSTHVLGTSFNILARANSYEVKCYTGKVGVSSKEYQVKLQPGEGVIVNSNLSRESIKFEAVVPEWTKGMYTYDNTPLVEVLADFELAYGMKVVISDEWLDEGYTGYFPTNDLDKALKLVFEPLGLTYEVSGKKVNAK